MPGEAHAANVFSFTTERLVVELPAPADAGPLFDLVGGTDRKVVCATLIWDGPDRVVDLEGWIERCRTKPFEDHGFHWVIRDRDGRTSGDAGAPLGAIGTRPRGSPGRAAVGYWLGKPFWGRGIMGEALAGLLGLGFGELGFVKIEADVFTGNQRGRRLVESVGMRQEGLVRRAYLKSGRWVDLALYGILAEEWSDVTET